MNRSERGAQLAERWIQAWIRMDMAWLRRCLAGCPAFSA